MSKKASAKGKTRPGRPATGITPMIGLRASPALRGSIVKWAENQPDLPKLSEAIRRLVELGLTVDVVRKPTATAGARAAELAAKVIDSRADATAPADVRDERKRRLLKGPSAFREMRRDRPKGK